MWVAMTKGKGVDARAGVKKGRRAVKGTCEGKMVCAGHARVRALARAKEWIQAKALMRI